MKKLIECISIKELNKIQKQVDNNIKHIFRQEFHKRINKRKLYKEKIASNL